MKNLIFILILSFANTSFSQTAAVSNTFVVTTPSRDTMYIINNSQGRTIYDTWIKEPTFEGYSPKVFLVLSLEPYRCCALRKCKTKKRS